MKEYGSNISYLVKHNNIESRMGSRSGGAYVAFSDFILEENGCVYGCVIDDNLLVKHSKATDKYTRNMQCGSKYAQSSMSEIFSDIKFELSNGRKVLFSGTGCQVDGLYGYLSSEEVSMASLYTIDIVCHGICSPQLFKDYIDYQEKRNKSKIVSFNFRDKVSYGWESHIETFNTIDGKVKSSKVWKCLFYSNCSLRPACYRCPYASLNRVADITLADAWGIGKSNPEFHDNRGVSLVLVNTGKGQDLFKKAKNDCTVIPVDINNYMQTNLEKPSHSKGNRDFFWDTYVTGGVNALVNKYVHESVSIKLKNKANRIVRKVIKGKDFYLPL